MGPGLRTELLIQNLESTNPEGKTWINLIMSKLRISVQKWIPWTIGDRMGEDICKSKNDKELLYRIYKLLMPTKKQRGFPFPVGQVRSLEVCTLS